MNIVHLKPQTNGMCPLKENKTLFFFVFLQEGTSFVQNGDGSFKLSKLFFAYSVCVISKYPYFNALKDCLSWWGKLYQNQTVQFV